MTPRFTFRRRVRFALWFCRRNLFESVASPVSWAVVAAVALSTAAACVALALPWVAAEIRLHRLAQSPWAWCVWAFAPTDLDQKFTPERLRELEAATRARIRETGGDPGREPEVTVAGFHDVTVRFYEFGGSGQIPRRGRTVGPGDPLLPAIPRTIRTGAGFDGPTGPGVILSPTLVERLGGSKDDPPPEVRIESPNSGQPRTWAVVGVTHDPLPLGHDFLLTEAEDERMRAADSDTPQTQIWSGPLGPGWPERWSGFPDAVQEAADAWKLEVRVQRRLGGPALQLASDFPRPVSEWKRYLIQIRNLMRDGGRTEAPEFDKVEAERAAAPPQPRGPYSKATIYVMDLKHLRPAADAARGMDLYANDAARTLVDEIEATADQAKVATVALVAAFCLAGFATLILALYLRGRQQAAQVGMMRAMGADDRTLRAIVATEAAVLWAAGALLGVIGAVALGIVGVRKYAVTPEELRAAAATGWWAALIAAFLLASLASCVFGNLLATRRVRRRPAAESLGLVA